MVWSERKRWGEGSRNIIADCELYNIHLWWALSSFHHRFVLNRDEVWVRKRQMKRQVNKGERRLWNSQIPSTYQASLFALITREYNCKAYECATNIISNRMDGKRASEAKKKESKMVSWRAGEECFCCWASTGWHCWQQKKRREKANNNNDKRKYPRAWWERWEETASSESAVELGFAAGRFQIEWKQTSFASYGAQIVSFRCSNFTSLMHLSTRLAKPLTLTKLSRAIFERVPTRDISVHLKILSSYEMNCFLRFHSHNNHENVRKETRNLLVLCDAISIVAWSRDCQIALIFESTEKWKGFS